MKKEEVESLLNELGVPYVKSNPNNKPMTEEELEEFKNTLSKTNFIEQIEKERNSQR